MAVGSGFVDGLLRQHPTGILRSFPRAYISLAAASATAAAFYTLSTGKRAIMAGIMASRRSGNASDWILVGEGTGAGFTQLIPDLWAIAGIDNEWTLDDGLPLLEFEAAAGIATVNNAAAAPNDWRVKATWFEF